MKKLFLPLLLCANLSFAQVDLNLGLKAYYPFSGNPNDVSGNNNNPVFNNATLTADRFGNPNSAYHFNGTSQYMRILNSASLNTSNKLSLVAWVRPQGFYAGTCHGNSILMKGDADYLTGNYFLRYDDGPFSNNTNCSVPVSANQNYYGVGVASASPGYSPYIQLNQWSSVIVTLDGTTAKLYVNCVLKASAPQGSATFTNAYDLYIGRLNSASFPYWVNGDIDEIRIYDRALNIDEVNTLGGCLVPTTCNNWLRTQAVGQTFTVGDLDVSGTQITIEAQINRNAPYSGNYLFAGDVVSKHNQPSNSNYLLRPNSAEITTSNGYFVTPPICLIDLNKTYYVAMVYDGTTLKFYRNGFLMSQVPATGALFLNNFPTTIGDYAFGTPIGTNFQGYINEVRIWNVARTQAQLQTYMISSIPNPATLTGLLAYYTFDNLLNKQGNAAWNGTLNGGATINNTNPNCVFVADSCVVAPGISGIINDYTPVLGLDLCTNKLTVDDATRFNTGDTVLIMQMKGAIIDSTNTGSFGTITDYKNAGNYEFNYVKTKVGNIIELRNAVTRQYDIPAGKVQLIRVPYYTTVNVTGNLTCLPWDGTKGGVLAFNVLNSLTLNADLDVSGRGFSGGIDPFSAPGSFNCNENQYYYPPNPDLASGKGEGIAGISAARSFGKGALANGGGGGVSHNSGGGGGGNISTGGFGGYQLEGAPCNITVPFDNRGLGGKALTYSNALNKIFLGGGGGAGHTNNPQAFESKGGNGGGIIIVSAGSLTSNAKKIIANGNNAPVCGLSTSGCHEGMGGGGAAGSVLLKVNSYSDNANMEAKGGKGSDMTAAGFTRVGPGGGGSGGLVWLSNSVLPGNVSVSNSGGLNGVCPAYSNDPWGSTPGMAGQNLFNLVLPASLSAFQKNIDSVRIKDSLLICNTYDFKGLAYINTSPITSWQWYFGDGGTANTQNTTHTYITAGNYIVKLVVSDINGCKDSISKTVNVVAFTADAGADTTICSGSPATVMLRASAGTSYAWTPAAPLNNPTIQNPVATISANTRFYVTITNAAGCQATDSVLVSLASAPSNMRYTTRDAFPYQNLQLQARNIGGTAFQWLPNIGLNDNSISNPVFYYNQSQEYTVRINIASGCVVVDTQLVVIKGKKGIYVPRGFTPNGDGNNDRLYPILVGIKQLNYFKIYNRWGNLLFESTSGRPEDGWDGTFKGLKQPVETYTWVVEGVDIDNIVITKNGNTLLIR